MSADIVESLSSTVDKDTFPSNSSLPSEHTRSPNVEPGHDSDTLIIFDWDDTLLCTSALNDGLASASKLLHLENVVESVLQAAIELGDTVIVTNANSSWVHDSSKRFFPRLGATLEHVAVVSAREMFEYTFPGEPFAWKRSAFRYILGSHYRKRRRVSCALANLIVLGDSPAEMMAAHHAAHAIGACKTLIKTVKFISSPSVSELIGQLERTTLELEGLTRDRRNRSTLLDFATVHKTWLDNGASWQCREIQSWDADSSMMLAIFGQHADMLSLWNLQGWIAAAGKQVATCGCAARREKMAAGETDGVIMQQMMSPTPRDRVADTVG